MTFYYDPILVALSIIIAIFGSFTALVVTTGYARSGTAFYSGVIMGGSIWSMHFVAMLALQLPVTINYDVARTLISLALAVVVGGLSLAGVSKRLAGPASIPIAGVLLGLGIAGMHYLGMDAIRGCGVGQTWEGVAISTSFAVFAATTALWFVFRRRNMIETLLGSLVLGGAIAGMHYIAMLTTSFSPLDIKLQPVDPTISQDTLAYAIGAAMMTICLANLIAVARSGSPQRAAAR
jgi:NO-binding membrane sensor protein with MHYT domain